MEKRRRFKQTLPLDERLLKYAEDCRAKARVLPPGKEKSDLVEKARAFERQIGMVGALLSPTASLDGRVKSPE
jgi:hypothetical protein